MSERKTKTYSEKGRSFSFDFDSFRELFTDFQIKKGISKEEAEIRIGELVGVTEHSVHSWRNRINAPIDIDVVRNLAEIFGAKNENILLIEKRKGIKMENLNDRQIESAKRIFDAIIDALYELKYNRRDYMQGYDEEKDDIEFCEDNEDLEETDDIVKRLKYIYSKVNREIDKIRNVIAREYFYLHDTEIYYKFSDFCDRELFAAYFDGYKSTYFCEAIKKLHTIIGTEAEMSIFEKSAPKVNVIKNANI